MTASIPAESYPVRRLTVGDVGLARDLNALFAMAFNEPTMYAAQPPRDAYLSDLLSKEQVIALVALDAGEVVGGLVGYEMDKLESETREIYLYDLAVADTHRRRGIASALIRRLSDIAAARNVGVIYVQADYGDEPAIALYQKLGPREEVMHFDVWTRDRQSPKPRG
jgi:aminoglycoside 3-N-acetyltransferase I